MPTVALAGGTSQSLGRAIATAVLSSTQWNVVILSRIDRQPLWLRAVDPAHSRISIRVVDYMSIDSLASSLHDVDTLISVLLAVDGSQPQVQSNLLHSAIKAGCRRFAPSMWGFGMASYEGGVMAFLNGDVWDQCLDNVDKIEVGAFNNGLLMNYLGHGMLLTQPAGDDDTKLQEMKQGGGYTLGPDNASEGLVVDGDLKDGSGSYLISLRGGIAELPVRDDGQWPRFSTTTLRDTGRFVAASLDLPKWELEMNIVGDTITMGELILIAEAVTGKEFAVTKLTPQEMEKQLSRLGPGDFESKLRLGLKLLLSKDAEGHGVLTPVVNNLCPGVKTITVREYLETHWVSQ